jgi:hypothetical protein
MANFPSHVRAILEWMISIYLKSSNIIIRSERRKQSIAYFDETPHTFSNALFFFFFGGALLCLATDKVGPCETDFSVMHTHWFNGSFTRMLESWTLAKIQLRTLRTAVWGSKSPSSY